MLRCVMITPEILEVEEEIHGFRGTEKRYFYTNIRTWEDLTNSSATKQVDNFKVARKYGEATIEWAKKYFLPRAVPCHG